MHSQQLIKSGGKLNRNGFHLRRLLQCVLANT